MNDDPPGGEHCAVAITQHNPSSCGQHDVGTLCELVNNFLLPVPETILSFDVKYPRHIGTSAFFYYPIGIVELFVQRFGEQPSNGALTHCHQTNEKNILFRHKKNGANLAPLVYQIPEG